MLQVFVFDIHLPADYPNVAPMVHFHSFGVLPKPVHSFRVTVNPMTVQESSTDLSWWTTRRAARTNPKPQSLTNPCQPLTGPLLNPY